MSFELPRGIAVIDAGATNTKAVLFSAEGAPLAERKVASRHIEGPPYRHIDPQPVAAFCREALPELDAIAPLDVIVPCAHGAALACLAEDGSLALPVMYYTSEPPRHIVESYRKLEPPFSEVFCRLLPTALTHGLQLYWQQEAYPAEFARIRTIVTWIQYVGFLLSGKPASEISSLSCQSQLMNVRSNSFSTVAQARGWDKLFPPIVKAWEPLGALKAEFRNRAFRGRGRVLAGVHDSNANYLRYLAAGRSSFTLLSSGTWIIGFDGATSLLTLEFERDTASNTNVFGQPVASCRFYGGRELEVIADGAPAEAASISAVARLISRGTVALPSFTDSGGPVPNSGGKGRIAGAVPASAEESASLAALYCAQMTCESLDAIGSKSDIIIDGPFSRNSVFVAVLAQLRARQRVFVSDLRDGTTAGAACLALMRDERLPTIALSLTEVRPSEVEKLDVYHRAWRLAAYRR